MTFLVVACMLVTWWIVAFCAVYVAPCEQKKKKVYMYMYQLTLVPETLFTACLDTCTAFIFIGVSNSDLDRRTAQPKFA